ncbi:PREDICTED: glycoprotein-N-acetylgalactosamine 3-beta-galactosyltransferase 1-like [Dinoponera quadriceps]|uniref:N-acetylgalactosaminide beta-1,3-galactosyltransferase n=1 Tax=Dinoponera quadriceps TaxID=609295 RepID=A0A6P3WT38_DINQU|nr:PREDICTED: glycoprotein-N-acetylgalactosamine 3-beta-galactosyltransferase 1-like [Dinoponera quadriceps]
MCLRFLKKRSGFLIGFAIGFALPLLFILWKRIFVTYLTYDQESWEPEYHLNKKPHHKEIILQLWKKQKRTHDYFNNVTYDAWLGEQNLRSYKIDLDKHLYGPQERDDAKESINLEWNWLSEQISITCVVFIEKLKLGKSIQATWGERCNNIYFFGHRLKNTELPVINVGAEITSSWQLLCEAMSYIWNDRAADKLKWVIFVKDDTMVIPENLRYMVAPLNHEDDYYLGHPIIMWGHPYNVAQAGYVLSRGTLAKVVKMFDSSEKCAAGGRFWKKEDYYLGKHLFSLGIHPSDTRDQYLRGTFHGYSLQVLLWGVNRPGSYWTRAMYPTKRTYCSPVSVTFSASEPDKMHTLNFLLYHLRVFMNEGKFGSIPAKALISEDDVWKIALEEEFNITHLDDITSDVYYKIWHSKYSEPGQLKITKDYRITLDCLLASYKKGNKLDSCPTESVISNRKT